MRFDDGLRHDFKSVVLLQQSKDLDTASTLALLQEEVAPGATTRAGRSSDWSSSAHFRVQPQQPLPFLPPPRQDKTQSAATQPDQAVAASPEG